jgi:hypothetical protein
MTGTLTKPPIEVVFSFLAQAQLCVQLGAKVQLVYLFQYGGREVGGLGFFRFIGWVPFAGV